MSKPKDAFLVFSDDWGEHPSSCQHLFRHIVREYPVVWVNTVGMRLPRLCKQDAQKALKKLKKMFSTASRGQTQAALPPGLSVLQPFMIPYNQGPFRIFNKHSVIKAVRKELRRRGLQNPILVTTVPNACDYIGAFGEKQVVYYCVDDFAEWPGHERELILQMEAQLVEKSDLFIATSEKLYQKLCKQGKPTFLLPHGVDLKAFMQTSPDQEHKDLAPIPHPRIGYVGLLDARLDWELLKLLLEGLPEISLVCVGHAEVDLSPLQRYPNFYHLPPVPYAQVPLILKSLDILILPYLVNAFTENINPLKLKEYLASGRKIMGTPLPEIKKYSDFVTLAHKPEDWINKIKTLLNQSPPDFERRLTLLSQEDWSFKAQKFLEMIFSAP